MKKILLTVILIMTCALAVFSAPAPAEHHHHFDSSSPRQMITASLFIFRPWSAGFRQRIAPQVYLTANMDYIKDDKDLRFQAGAIYRMSDHVLFFHLYGGGGLEFSRNDGYLYPYLMVGADFWIFFTEVSHPLKAEQEPTARFGFRFTF